MVKEPRRDGWGTIRELQHTLSKNFLNVGGPLSITRESYPKVGKGLECRYSVAIYGSFYTGVDNSISLDRENALGAVVRVEGRSEHRY